MAPGARVRWMRLVSRGDIRFVPSLAGIIARGAADRRTVLLARPRDAQLARLEDAGSIEQGHDPRLARIG
jgi:hypothetical protein